MPNRKKTSKAFKALKKDKFSRDSLGSSKAKSANLTHLLQLQQQQKNKNRKRTDIALLPTSVAFNEQLSELEARKNGKKRKAQQTANITLAPGTFTFEGKPDILFADSLLEGEESEQQSGPTASITNRKQASRYFQNRFEALMENDEDDDLEPTSKNLMTIQPATFSFPRPEQQVAKASATVIDDSDI